jgi:hypothetical protein
MGTHTLASQRSIARHALPQRPQWRLSLARFAQMSPHCICPAGHSSTQTPARQIWLPGHTLPQRPQFVGSVASVAHDRPHATCPAPQVGMQLPPPQSCVAEHARPQVPQFAGSLAVTTQAPPQRVCPTGQGNPHTPAVQVCPAVQAVPQRPQFMLLMRVSTSQPLVAVPSQSAKPVAQVAMRQVPIAQPAVALAPTVHALRQRPQWAALVEVFTSQPFAALPSQSAKPGRHAKPQVLRSQVGVAFATAGHRLPQRPQCDASSRSSVSQPVAAIPLQSPKPPAQAAGAHTPMRHATVAFGKGAHTVPHAPQFVMSFWRFVSHPSVALRLQSAKPVLQRSIAHDPMVHAGVALLIAHARPHMPQAERFDCVSTQPPPQQL